MGPRASARNPAERVAEAPPCDGLLAQVGGEDLKPGRRLALAKAVVERRLPGAWEVRPLGRGADVFEVRRARKNKRIDLRTAWNHSYRLRADPAVGFAEPSVTTVGHDPTPEQISIVITPAENAFTKEARLTGDEPLPCAENNKAWSLEFCRVDEAWKLTPPPGGKRLGEGIVVGHPDTGYTRHPEIWDAPASKLRVLRRKGWDFEDDDPEAEDPLAGGFLKQPGHGTATSSVIMSTPASPDVSGVAPAARLIPIRVTKSVVLFDFGKLAKAIYHAVERGAHVISMSLGGPVKSRTLEHAVAHAVQSGVVVLAAAGNVWPWVVYPARLGQVIGVGANNCEGRVWKKSARGDGVDLCAPGEGVWRADIEDWTKADMGYGTSFAVATTAGACALWLAYHGRDRLIERYGAAAVPPVFRHLLLSTVKTPDGWDTERDGAGILDVEALLAAPLPDAHSVLPFRPEALGAAEELLGYFPEDDPGAVMKAALDLLHARGPGVRPLWSELGDEVLFHVATDPGFRAAIQERARAGDAFRSEAGPDLGRFRTEASDRLRAAVERR